MSDSKWFVVINPSSGNGRAKKQWPKIKHLLELEGFLFDHDFTKSGAHNIDLISSKVKEGFTHFICVGGDGTIHNTVNGIMLSEGKDSSKCVMGVIPIGTGNDWIKTYQIPKNPKAAIDVIKNGHTTVQDIGKIDFDNTNNPSVYFNNLAGVGFDGYVVSKVGTYKHFGALAYLIGAVIGLFSFKNFNVTVQTESDKISTPSLMVLIGLCAYSGGGMQLTKTPNPNDGLFDISIAKNLSKWNIISNLTKLFNGKIVNYKKVQTLKTPFVKVSVSDQKMPFIQADGELIGVGNFTASIVPRAIRFIVKN